MNIRQTNWNIAKNKCFDITIIGGGINGAAIYKKLSQQGYKVFLVDKGDFSCGTSQASAMMIWGGLLYLKNLDFLSVYNLSKDRDDLIESYGNQIISRYFRYIPNSEWGRNKYFVYLALQFYWLLGKCKRRRPSFQQKFEELSFINKHNGKDSLIYQEGFLKQSDSRFVLDWIVKHQTEESLAINYCSILNATYNNKDKLWSLDLKDNFARGECTIKSKMVLNCAGVWTDEVNKQFRIQSPYKHVFSKGVFIGFERPVSHRIPLIFEMGKNGDTLTFIPWGPVSLWGPTETMEKSIKNGYTVKPDDIDFLLKHASRNLNTSLSNSKIISLRCGLRPLAVKKTFEADCYPLDLSRNHRIVEDLDLPWISIYGGKISGCLSLAHNVAKKISKKVSPSLKGSSPVVNQFPVYTSFPGLQEQVPTVDWCVANEFCCTLEDYLRRRTNIAQWVSREGLGAQAENIEYLRGVSSCLPIFEEKNHEMYLNEYKNLVQRQFDTLVDGVNRLT
ncbi:MAG: FAD-dependent oxidoreductase [Desulfobulbaceae bacterium]|nr:FAD-dependent oxidoreductase [Desulfobulbaceae bacterium]